MSEQPKACQTVENEVTDKTKLKESLCIPGLERSDFPQAHGIAKQKLNHKKGFL